MFHIGIKIWESLVIVNTAAINVGVHVSLLYTDLNSFRYMPKSGTAEY
jgi:hypothetical protein